MSLGKDLIVEVSKMFFPDCQDRPLHKSRWENILNYFCKVRDEWAHPEPAAWAINEKKKKWMVNVREEIKEFCEWLTYIP